MARANLTSAIKGDTNGYEEAVKTLNTLQTNFQTLEKIRQDRDKYAHLNVPNMLKYAQRAGISVSDMDRLNVIHVSGTKGKGSTCAYCESILRHHGYSTGFFSSPHLVEVRERFIVNGSYLDRDKFAQYFWEVYNKLDTTKDDHEGKMPNYFGFLTLMSLHVFLQEKVDVAIMEVGIGGQYDSTNLIRNPVVCGVTSLGLDHTSILGATKDKIAWHKAGIFKPGVPAFTVPQSSDALTVLQNRSIEIGCPLNQCPDLDKFGSSLTLGIQGPVQATNASLAVQLCHTWMNRYKRKVPSSETDTETTVSSPASLRPADVFQLTPQYLQGLEQCRWLGRNQKIETPGVTFYLDGAHTTESIQQCVDWFQKSSKQEERKLKSPVYRVLLFNTTGDRPASSLIKPLQTCHFDVVLFCPNVAYETCISADQTNNSVSKESQIKKCLNNKKVWEDLLQEQTLVNKLDTQTESQQPVSSNIQQTVHSVESKTNGHKSTGDLQNGHCSSSSTGLTDNQDTACLKQNLLSFPSISCSINWVCKKVWSGEDIDLGTNLVTTNDADVIKGDNRCDNKTTTETEDNEKRLGDGKIVEPDCDEDDSGSLDSGLEDEGPGFEPPHIQVLVSGSLHLVGGALRVLRDKGL